MTHFMLLNNLGFSAAKRLRSTPVNNIYQVQPQWTPTLVGLEPMQTVTSELSSSHEWRTPPAMRGTAQDAQT